MKIDFDHTTGNGIADLMIRNMQEEQNLKIISLLKPDFLKDGNQYCYLYGENLQEGIAGFGDTVAEAMDEFCRAFYSQKAV